ncbi:hypothetical protein [Candidatus Uabimicrobium amorphum]|uniref:Uncharacterized protein n=1 Tax=Uabimicrobium amorphum TaxID=2596890 RepID=A0A5S9IM19_UABAM|nr:hypothetical protein [Candidatus Uabimicrobium amorphum]BBM84383.1 hypothetical protein UABAM_02742 [Candidatus Uabimicrobium amorphum]
MKKIKAAILFTIVVTAGVAGYFFWSFSTASVTIKEVKINLHEKQVNIDVHLVAQNIPVIDFDIHYAIATQSNTIVEGSITLPAQKIENNRASLVLPTTIFIDKLQQIRQQNSKTILLEFNGSFQAASQSIEIPFHFSREIPLPKGNSNKHLQIDKLIINILEHEILISADIIVENPKEKDIPHFNVDYNVVFNDSLVVEGKLISNGIPAKSEGIVTLPLRIQKTKLLRAKSSSDAVNKLLIKGNIATKHMSFHFSVRKNILLASRKLNAKIHHINVQQPLHGPTTINAQLTVANTKKIKSGKVHYNVLIDEQKVATGSVEIESTKQQLLLNLPAEIDLDKIRTYKQNSPLHKLKISGFLQLQTESVLIDAPFEVHKNIILRDRHKPRHRVKNIDVVINHGHVSINAIVEIKNSSDKDIEHLHAVYKVSANNKHIVSGKAMIRSSIASFSRGELAIPVKINTQQLKALPKNALCTFIVSGKLHAKLSGKEFHIPFTIAKEVLLKPREAKAEVQNLLIRVNSDRSMDIEASLKISNTKPRKAKITYRVSLANTQVVTGRALLTPKNKEMHAQIPIKINVEKLKTLRKKHGGQVVPLVLTGKAFINDQQVPFRVRKDILLSSPKRNVRVLGLEVKEKAGKKHIRVKLDITPAPKIKALNITYNMFMNHNNIAKGKFNYVKDTHSSLFEIPIVLDKEKLEASKAENIGKLVPFLITGNIQGETTRGKVQIPFRVEKDAYLQGKSLEIKSVALQILKMSRQNMQLQLKLNVFSKFAHDIKKLNITYRKIVKGVQVMGGEVHVQNLVAQKVNVIRIPLHIARKTWNDMKEKYEGQTLRMILKGHVEVETASKHFQFPFEVHKNTVIRKRPFEIKLNKFRIRKWRFRERVYHVILTLKSLLPHKIENLRIEGDIQLTKAIKARVLNKNITLKPNASIDLEIEVKRKRIGLIRRIIDKIRDIKTAKTNLKIEGTSEEGTVFSSHSNEEQPITVVEENE